MANKKDAIVSLMKDDPEISMSWTADTNTINNIVYLNGQTPLTDEQIEAEEIRLTEKEAADQIIFDSEEWKRKRQWEYPDVLECVHALLDGGDTLTELQSLRQAVKDKYPKP